MSGDIKLSVLIGAIDRFSAPARKISSVSEEMATRLRAYRQYKPPLLGRLAAGSFA
jgi:hypothetical protein